MTLSAVVLPAPEGPASARQRPGSTSRARSRSNSRSGLVALSSSIASGLRTAQQAGPRQQLDREQQRPGDGDEDGRQRQGPGEVAAEGGEDRQRHRLRDPLEG